MLVMLMHSAVILMDHTLANVIKVTLEMDSRAQNLDNADGYTCSCKPGFNGDGYVCSDIKNCDIDDECHANATCAQNLDNADGYTCSCKPGFNGDGYVCSDIKNCDIDDECHANATC